MSLGIDKPTVALFYEPLKKGDIDLVEMVGSYFKLLSSEADYLAFISEPDITSVQGLNQASQRITINRVLVNKLLSFRSAQPVSVYNVVNLLGNDGFTEDWLTVIKEFVVPFFKETGAMKIS